MTAAAAATVNEGDIVELCKLGIDEVKKIMPPDTTRILLAFDAMMLKVKKRSSQKRHPDINRAIERCFVPFAGRGKTVVGVREFARRLSVLSMEWSGNFSQEECLALAQVIADEGTPGIITLESFKYAAYVGSEALVAPARPCADVNERETRGGHYAQEYSRRDDWCDVLGLGGARNQGNRKSALTRTDGEAVAEHGRGEEEGGGDFAFSKDAVEETLNLAASEARSAGHDVWRMLDAAVLAHLGGERGEGSHESESEAKKSRLTAESLRRFLAELNIRVVPVHPPDHFPITDQVETVARAGKEHEDRAYTGNSESSQSLAPAPLPPPSSLPTSDSSGEAQGIRVLESRLQGASVADRYIHTISTDTASVRSRVQFYNRELDRTRGEAEVLISQAAKPWEFKASLPDDKADDDASGTVFENSSTYVSDEVHDSPPSRKIGAVMGDMGASAGNCGGCSRSPYKVVQVSTGSSVQGSNFCRVSPLHRPDASHPRVYIRPCSSREYSRSVKLLQLGDVDRTDREQDRRAKIVTRDGKGVEWSRGSRSGVGGRDSEKAKMLAAAQATREEVKTPRSASTGQKANPIRCTSGPRNHNHRSVTFHETRFDAPDVRNGLNGLTKDHVDEILLQVETSIPRSKSCWKSTDITGGRRKRGITEADVAQNRPRERERTRARALGSECGSQRQPALWEQDQLPGVGWERLYRVIKTPATARPLPADRKNIWHKEKMKWVSPRDRNDKNPVDRSPGFTLGSRITVNRVPFSADTTLCRSLRGNI